MSYAFCLFWPANVLPVFVLVCQMQLFIPLNTLFGRACCGRPEYKKHIAIAFLIIAGVILSFVSYVKDLVGQDNFSEQLYYLCTFTGGQFIYVMAHQTKESIVRSMLLNQTTFNFQVSLAQLFISVAMILAVLNEN